VLLLDEIQLILANLFGPEAGGGGAKVLGKLGDTAERAVNGLRRIVAALEVFAHPLA
jgi:hypothetical protein